MKMAKGFAFKLHLHARDIMQFGVASFLFFILEIPIAIVNKWMMC